VQGDTATPGTVALDYLILVPQADGYGKARAVVGVQAGVVSIADSFAQTAGALNAKTTSLGGAVWATSGGATDFQVTGSGAVTRTAIDAASWGGRYAIAGTATFTDVAVHCEGSGFSDYSTQSALSEDWRVFGVIARYIDASNWFMYASVKQGSTNPYGGYRAIKSVAGVRTAIGGVITHAGAPSAPGGNSEAIDLSVFADGTFTASIVIQNTSTGTRTYTLSGQDADLATGGTLATGKTGFYTEETVSGTADTYTFDNFYVIVMPQNPQALYSGRSMQVRYDDTLRQDSTGVFYGRPPAYRGSRFLVPVGTSRVLVKARRNDIETTVDDQVTDATQVQVGWTPRGLVVPRA
jgi:hypothetical protein